MNRSSIVETIKVGSIFHPSGFSHASEIAFACPQDCPGAEAKLTMLDVKLKCWMARFPGVREDFRAAQHKFD